MFPITATINDVKIWTRTDLHSTYARTHAVIGCYTNSCDSVENWELKVTVPSPGMFYSDREVEVTSVNWQSKDSAAALSHVLVSYRWHGIMYAVKFITAIPSFTSRLVQMLEPKNNDCILAVAHG
jgi:hypothetical protein